MLFVSFVSFAKLDQQQQIEYLMQESLKHQVVVPGSTIFYKQINNIHIVYLQVYTIVLHNIV